MSWPEYLDTRRHAITKASLWSPLRPNQSKPKEEEEDAPPPPPKSSVKPSTTIAKKDKKINVQSAQIKDPQAKTGPSGGWEFSDQRTYSHQPLWQWPFSNASICNQRLVLLVKLVAAEGSISSSYQNHFLESYHPSTACSRERWNY